MKALVDAEVLKLRSTRMPLGLLLATMLLVALTAAVSVPSAGDGNSPVALGDPTVLARIAAVGVGVSEVMMVLLGVLAYTQEFRHGTIATTLLITPQRGRVLRAKWSAVVIASVPVTIATLAVSIGICAAVLHSRRGNITAGAQLFQMTAATFLVMAAFGVLGVAVGALVRNQIAAVVVVLVWMLVVEQLLISAYPSVGRWTPVGVTFSLLQLGPEITTKSALLSAPVGGLLLVAYTALAGALAHLIALNRDVL